MIMVIIIGVVMTAAIAFLIWTIVHPIKKVSKTNETEGKRVNKRYLLWTALVIAAIVGVRPMFWLGIIGFAGMMAVLAVFAGLVVTYLLSLKKGSLYREIGFVVLIIVAVFTIFILKFSAPELNASEVKKILSYPPRKQERLSYPGVTVYHWVPGQEALSADYKGNGVWRVKVRQGVDVFYLHYDENTKEIKRW